MRQIAAYINRKGMFYLQKAAAVPRSRGSLLIALGLLVLSLVLLLVHFLFLRHSFPPVTVDEASFFSPAADLVRKGVLSSDVHRSFLPGAASHTYWMPPFYMIVLAGFMKVTGTTLFAAKLLSLLFALAAALVLHQSFASRYARRLIPALFLVCPFVIISSSFIRMEALGLLLLSLSVYSLARGSQTWVRGMLAALMILTHPMLVPASAALLVVTSREGWRTALVFLAFAGLFLLPYLFYVLQDLEAFREQMALQLARKSSVDLLRLEPSYLLQLLSLLGVGLVCLKSLRRPSPLRLFLTISLVLTGLLAVKSNEFNYHVYLVPFTLAALGMMIDEGNDTSFRRMLPLALYGLFLALIFFKADRYGFRTDKDYREITAFLEDHTEWQGKRIYVDGNPDLAAFLVMRGQDVERKNAVASRTQPGWEQKYNCVIEVGSTVESGEGPLAPWHSWRQMQFFTSEKNLVLRIFVR